MTVMMEQILNLDQFDINLLDNVVRTLYTSTVKQEREKAQTVLGQFQENPSAWMKVDAILEQSKIPETKFFGLIILESLIKFKWRALPREQSEGIKNFVVSMIIKLSSDPQSFQREKVFLNKLNLIFVHILKKEWPSHWSSFIPEIVNSSKTNETLCENNMVILRLLSEEIFNFGEEQMTQAKIQQLKNSFEKEFSLINELCQFILEKAHRPQLIKETLLTLQKFLSWIPLHYIIEKDKAKPSFLIQLLLQKFFPEPMFRNLSLRCLTEIVSISLPQDYQGIFVHIIDQVLAKISLKPDISKIAEDYENGDQNEQDFIQGITLFLTSFFKNNLKSMEGSLNIPYLTLGHEILVSISHVEDIEIFKICLDYWNTLASNLYSEPTRFGAPLQTTPPRIMLYKSILSKVRNVLISRMAKPEEVIIVEDENGNVIREQTRDTDSLTLYELMRETLDHWKFLKTVVKKLFEFMHESHPGVQDMACDTFLKISKATRRRFVIQQADETNPFINEILEQLPTIISDLEPHQIQTFYEAVGYMISSSTDAENRERFVILFMSLPNQTWQQIMGRASVGVENIVNLDVVKSYVNLLKTNHKAAISLGPFYLIQIKLVYLDMLNVYRAYSDYLTKHPQERSTLTKNLKTAKKETLKLLQTFIEKSEDKSLIYNNFIGPLLDAVLGDYQTNLPETREPEVLSLLSTIVNSLKQLIHPDIPKILESVFECTLNMITTNFEDFPDHRINFFTLIRSVNQNAFHVFQSLSAQQFKLLVDCIVWAFKHTERNISETGLNILKELMENINKQKEISNVFYPTYIASLLTDVLYILTDSFHKSGFPLQCEVIKVMFTVVDSGLVSTLIYDPATNPNIANNTEYLKVVITKYLSATPNVSPHQIELMTHRLFGLTNASVADFRSAVRDFLITLKEFQADNNELYIEERNAEREAALNRAKAIPGMVRPNENEEMVD
ncbi:hypothetical protein DFA_01581 [Cavenderia fasciculata]|uniref:Importin N-terminal domain-containing protein n=1 Tax=Cavenderia fasciculata TaxID=261658 RepID=F4PTM5_CACFS|nr:uncharacterized protein DFA_01581 [Cavenderia fasciculata]EGG21695.1 hypothetical protein DFA_01581 [Cavenderia fasciculata]|eukprot:XP_004359545.1 hypothetical protein DFA_01581 [Cavenderia fasciculata]